MVQEPDWQGIKWPILFAAVSANQMVPSGATVMPCSEEFGVGALKRLGNCLVEGSYSAIWFVPSSVSQILPLESIVMN